MHARAIGDASPKSRWPLDCDAGAVLFADQAGRRFLRGQYDGIDKLLFVEGMTDLIAWSCMAAAEGLRVAIIGVESGSAPALSLVRIPPGFPHYVATHDDVAGDRYAESVANAIAPRAVRRVPLHLLSRIAC